jgi:hypothetical protein
VGASGAALWRSTKAEKKLAALLAPPRALQRRAASGRKGAKTKMKMRLAPVNLLGGKRKGLQEPKLGMRIAEHNETRRTTRRISSEFSATSTDRARKKKKQEEACSVCK